MFQLKQEKLQLESNLAKEQESQVNKLLRRIEKLEADTNRKQSSLEQVFISALAQNSQLHTSTNLAKTSVALTKPRFKYV